MESVDIDILNQFNSYLFTSKLNNPKSNNDMYTNKGKEIKYKNKVLYII